jgi:hypothetical protein
MAENPRSFEYFIPVTEVEKKDKMVSHSATEKCTGLRGVGGILRQAQTPSLRPPTLLLCTSLKFSKIVPDRVDEGERGDGITKGKKLKDGQRTTLPPTQNSVLSERKKSPSAPLLSLDREIHPTSQNSTSDGIAHNNSH